MPDKKDTGKIVSLSRKPDIGFGRVLRAYRTKAGMDQEVLSKYCGVSGNCISNWERGVSRPDISLVPTLCRVLNMPLHALFEMEDPNRLTRDERSLVSDYRRMTQPNRRQLCKIAAAVLESQDEARQEYCRREYRYLPLIDCALAAGFGAPIDEEPETKPAFVRSTPEAERADALFPVNGHSMEPDYPDGSLVYIKKMSASALSCGDVIACIVAGTPYVKIYETDGLHSINPDYAPMRIGEDDNVRLIGRVTGCVPEEALASGGMYRELLNVFDEEIKGYTD